MVQPTTVGIVAIGRNEGERLRRCLESAVAHGVPVVYVDSGSNDGSQELATRLGAHLVELDMSRPFTAARARNAGYERLRELAPELRYVQFVDGDCELAASWLARGERELDGEPDLAVVSGRRRERFPQASIYNQLTDMEWAVPPGYVDACHGDALMRVIAFEEVGRFRPDLIAGEEPELSVRFRNAGWKLRVVDAEMTLHDAAMMHFSQFWKRARRAGHAFAEGALIHGRGPTRHWVREVRSIAIWGMAVPVVTGLTFLPTLGASLPVATGLYATLAARVYGKMRRDGWAAQPSAIYAASVVVGKFANAQGMVDLAKNRLRGRKSTLIEYK